MADDAMKEFFQGVSFRDDILRGVRLFLIAFGAILFGYCAYQMLRPTAEAQGAPQDAAPAPQPAQPASSPAAEAISEPRPLIVPEPPPAAGAAAPKPPPVRTVAKKNNGPDVPPPPPLVRATRAPAISGRDFETPTAGPAPHPTTEVATEANPAPTKATVGYKSLIEANPNRPAPVVELAPAPAPLADSADKPKGNRFARAIGRIFKGGKKDADPLTLQPKPQQ
jgi:hypothetical protein